jgi:hypothetical protein
MTHSENSTEEKREAKIVIPTIPRTGMHSQDHFWRRAAWNLRNNYDAGGSTVRAAIADVLDQVADALTTDPMPSTDEESAP